MKFILVFLCLCFVNVISAFNDVVISALVMTFISPGTTVYFPDLWVDEDNAILNDPLSSLFWLFEKIHQLGPMGFLTKAYEEVETTTIAAAKNVTKESLDSKLRRMYLQCINDTEVDPKLVIKFKAGDWVDDPTLKMWSLCVLYKMGIMSRQAVYQYDTVMSRVNSKDKVAVDKIINKCLSQKAKPPREIAWNYLKCYHKTHKKNEFPAIGILYTL